MSPRTKKYRNESIIYCLLSWLCLVGPVIWFCLLGFGQAETKSKLCLGIAFIVAAILTVINIIMKSHLRSVLWVLVLGVFFVTDKYMYVILTMAITTFLEELIFSPLHRRAKQKYIINKEIDSRG